MFRQYKLPAFGQGMSQKTKNKYRKNTKSRDTLMFKKLIR